MAKICKIVYFDEDSVTDYVQIVAGGTLEKTTELLTSSDLGEKQKAYASAKGGISGVFKALLGWKASASGEVSAGLALNRNKMVKNIVKNTILTDFLHIINENKSASKTTRGAIKKFDGYVISAEKDSLFRSRLPILAQCRSAPLPAGTRRSRRTGSPAGALSSYLHPYPLTVNTPRRGHRSMWRGYILQSHPWKRKTLGQKVPRSLFHIRFLFGLAQLRRLLGLPVIQQRNDLVFHFPRGLVLAEILFQFRTIDDHLVYLLFLLRQNTVDHIAIELAILVQLSHFLRLRQRGLLPSMDTAIYL